MMTGEQSTAKLGDLGGGSISFSERHGVGFGGELEEKESLGWKGSAQ